MFSRSRNSYRVGTTFYILFFSFFLNLDGLKDEQYTSTRYVGHDKTFTTHLSPCVFHSLALSLFNKVPWDEMGCQKKQIETCFIARRMLRLGSL